MKASQDTSASSLGGAGKNIQGMEKEMGTVRTQTSRDLTSFKVTPRLSEYESDRKQIWLCETSKHSVIGVQSAEQR